MSAADQVLAWPTALAVTGVAAVVSARRNRGEAGLNPLTVDGFPQDSSVIRRVLFKEPGDASAGVPELLGILVQDI